MSRSGPPKILVVDDDARLRDLLRRYLTDNGMSVYAAESAQAMNRLWQREHFDLLILDLMMPGEDGLSVLRRLRGSNDLTPVLMLTAKGEDVDRIVGLELGADDYLPKPFNPRELLARIHAVLRRKGPAEAPGAPAQEAGNVSFGEFVLDLGTRTLTRNGEPVPLTTGEFSVLKAFARFSRVPLSRDKLMEMARGREYEAFDRSLDVQISRLRKLLEPDPAKPRYIQTVWGLGYVFIPDGEAK
jgi:two-component system phosphate regulon response regulator OmpR